MNIYYLHTKIHIDPRMFLDINGHDYHISVEWDKTCDFVLGPSQAPLPRLILDIWHNHENQIDKINGLLCEDPDLWIISNAWHPSWRHERFYHIDFLFNRTRAYYQQFPFSLDVQRWYHLGDFCFVDFPLRRSEKKTRIFVAPNKTYPNDKPRKYRTELVKFLLEYQDLGHIGNSDARPELYLRCHHEHPWAKDINELSQKPDITRTPLFRYSPPHNAYYQDTFISIYGETIEYGNTLAVTEKTYDPLLKGHFILPFSARGFIEHLKSLNYRFPDFIDYSYDSIANDDDRFAAYLVEARRLLATDMVQWKFWWDGNTDILYHNKRLMHERPYDRVDIKKFMRV